MHHIKNGILPSLSIAIMPSQEDLNVSSPAPEEDAWVRGPEEDILALRRKPTIPSNATTHAVSRASRSHKSAPPTQGIREALRFHEDEEAAPRGRRLSRRIVLDEAPSESEHSKERVVESDRTRPTEEMAGSGISRTEEARSKRPFPGDQGKVDSAQHERQARDTKRRRMK